MSKYSYIILLFVIYHFSNDLAGNIPYPNNVFINQKSESNNINNKLIDFQSNCFRNGISTDTVERNSDLSKSVYFEILGAGYYLFSFNHEIDFYNRSFFTVNGRIGLSFGPSFSNPLLIFSIPVLLNTKFRLNKTLAFEIGGGYLIFSNYITLNSGLRILNKKGFLFKINFTPQFRQNNSRYFISGHRLDYSLWFGFSFGKSF